MYWSEDSKEKDEFIIPENIIDVIFTVKGKAVPLDNAYVLSKAIESELPWIAEDDSIGIHQIYGAESGNGWLRPENDANEVLYLSRRQKLTVRIPKDKLSDIQALTDKTLKLGDFEISIGTSTSRKLSDMNIIFARHVVVEQAGLSENEFMEVCVDKIKQMGIQVKKMMCGRERTIYLPDKEIVTRGLMIADLEKMESVRLQEEGLGIGRKLGCGLFLPQKGIDAVNPD